MHALTFRNTFAVRALSMGATPYDVSTLLGITMAVCELHYSSYVKEVQERGKRLVDGLDLFGEGIQDSTISIQFLKRSA